VRGVSNERGESGGSEGAKEAGEPEIQGEAGAVMKPIVYDLCCGSGGWATGLIVAGYRVIGYDIDPQPLYPGEFRQADVTALDGADMRNAVFIVASPPCEQFSRHQMPWTKRRNPPPPDLSIVEACWRIAAEAGLPIILENVRAAQAWLGRAKWHCGAFYLWGDVPALMPRVVHRPKESYGSKDRLKRARVPLELAEWIGRCFLPELLTCPMKCGSHFSRSLGKYGCPNCHGEGLAL
jgi:hypothetical protein